MHLRSSLASLITLTFAAVLPVAAPADSAVIQVAASGRVGGIFITPGVTTNLTPNSRININFSFDTDQLVTTFSSPTEISYQFNPTNFSTTIGDFVFPLAPNSSDLFISNFPIDFGDGTIGRGVFQSFRFVGEFGVSPFNFSGGSRTSELFVESFIDITNSDLPSPSLAILDPKLTRDNQISYFTRNFDRTQRANFSAVAVTAAFVPEPSTWAMLVIGFGLIGGAMRRRGARTKAAPSAA